MDGMIRVLEWWITFSLLAENAAECRMRLEDIGPDLLEGICLRSELPGCTGKDWAGLLHEAGTYNSHVLARAVYLDCQLHIGDLQRGRLVDTTVRISIPSHKHRPLDSKP